MRNFTFLLTFLFLITAIPEGFAQKVIVIGTNNLTPDGFSFVATENLSPGEIIYFTENEYSDSGNAFVDQVESVVKFTVTSTINTSNVVFIKEISVSSNSFTVSASGGGGTAIKTAGSGSFSLASDGETLYAYSDSDENPANGVTEIYSVLFTGESGSPGGSLPVNYTPVNDFPNAIVIQGFPAVSPSRTEFNFSPATLRDGVSKAMFQNTSNYLHAQANADLSIVPFTNLNLSGSNPVLTLTSSPASVTESSGASITYTFLLSTNATSAVNVNFTVGGTASFTTDYTQAGATSFNASNGTVTIAGGSNTASVTITPTGDTDLEPDESVVLTVTAGSGYDAGSPSLATGIIVNDDTAQVTPLVAVTGMNHLGSDGFSFVALNEIIGGTVIYFTENSFNNTSLTFSMSEAILSWTAPAGGVPKGEVVVVKEDSPNNLSVTCSNGSCGTIVLESGSFDLASNGEGMFAYTDTDNNPLNGVSEVHSVLFTGTTSVSGGNIPAIEDPSLVYIGAVVVDGFSASSPNRTEFDPTKRNVTVDRANFQNTTNWLHTLSNQDLSTIPFGNIIIAAGSANPVATVTVSPSNVAEDAGTGIVYTFSLSVPASGNLTINFNVGGTATFNTDYTVAGANSYAAASGSITILDGTSSSALTITPTADTDVEILETVELMIASGTGYDGGSPNDATASISNDDTKDSDPIVAITGLNHLSPDGFSFVAAKDIPANTKIYFTDNSFNKTTLVFGAGEAVLSWTSPSSVVPAGQVIVVNETTSDVFSLTRSGGSSNVGSITLVSGNFSTSTNGETFYAYEDDDDAPTNGVVDIYAVLYTGDATTSGGSIPPVEDPSGIYLSALVVDGFPAISPNRTEYDPTKRNVLVETVNFENTANWLHAQTNQVLSTVPFNNINIVDITSPQAVCKDITVLLDAAGSAIISGADVDNGSTDDIGISLFSLDKTSLTCADVGTPVTVTLTVSDAAGNSSTCTSLVSVIGINDTTNVEATSCDPGQVGVTQSLLTNQFGCDSLVIITTTLLPSDTTNIVATSCDPAQVGVTQQVFTNSFGCDSVVIIFTTLLPSDTTNVSATTCDPAQVGITQQVFSNIFGCDSVVITTTTFLPSDTTNVVATTCDPAQVGITLQVFSNIFGCDSVVITTTTLLPSDTTNVSATTCDPAQVGVTQQVFTNIFGCDSVVIITTTGDKIAPVAACKNITVQLDENGQASIVPADVDSGSDDNCNFSLSVAPDLFTLDDIGTNNVILTITDDSGNTDQCAAVVNVENYIETTLGNNEVHGSTSLNVNRRALPVTFGEDGDINSISIYHNGGSGDLLLAVYSDQPGSPSSRLGVTASTAINSTEGWQTVPLVSPVTVTTGQTVWLAWVFENNPGIRFTSGAPGRAQSSGTWSGGMPAAFGAASITNYVYSIYCTFSTGPTPPTLVASPTDISLGNGAGSSGTFNITSNVSWNISDDADWLDVEPVSGSNNGTITVTANSENNGDTPRTATVTITGDGVDNKTVIVTQEIYSDTANMGNTDVFGSTSLNMNRRALPVVFTEDGDINSISIYHNGGSGDLLLAVYSDQPGSPSSRLGVTASTAINSTEGWQTIPLESPVTVTTGQTVWLAWVFENNPGIRFTSGTPGRVASFDTWSDGMPATFGAALVADYVYSIYCTYSKGPTPPTLVASPTDISIDDGAGSNGTFNITSNTSWNISDDADWLDVEPVSGSNNGTITVTANSENTGDIPRTATVTITGDGVDNKTVIVTQEILSVTATLGNTDVYGTTSLVANRRALPVTFTEDGDINSISIYHNGGSGDLILAVYSDQTGSPASRMGVTASTSINSTEGWQTLPLESPVTVTTGQTFWLAWVFENNPGIRYTSGTPGRAQSFGTWSGGMPSTFGTVYIADYRYSIHCTYTVKTDEPKSVEIISSIIVSPQVKVSELNVYPNPFSDKVNFQFTSAVNVRAILEIYSVTGQKISTLMDKQIEGGVVNRIEYEPTSNISGFYIYRLKLDDFIKVGRVIYKNE